ncbi:LPD38 domain-containing protein [Endozoicomonas atrinae]|uniref:LPD38 domain-containing protein n=1 Tax=Endozoicomonas atrinae TaxID=1333660 RepID=UPI00082494EF|nr:LPD38 domain-containing protein [Endozoicomonas atrinae]
MPEWEKLGFHHFWVGEDHFRIPKPFEVGGIFATIPEIMEQSLSGREDMKWTRDMVVGLISDTFAMSLVPQAIAPMVDVARNKKGFTGAPILSMSLERNKPEAQYDPWTSETIRQLVQAVPEGAPDWMRSPKQLQYLLEGYFGTLGRYAIQAADIATREITGAAPAPAMNKRDIPVVGSFVRDGVDASRYTTELYGMARDVQALDATIKRYQESGEDRQAKALEQSAAARLKNKAGLQKASRDISKLRKEVRKVMERRMMDRDTKRERLDRLNRQINQMAADAVKKYQRPFRQAGLP